MTDENFPQPESIPQTSGSPKPENTSEVGAQPRSVHMNVAQSTSSEVKKKYKALLIILGGILLAAGLVFIGYKLGQSRPIKVQPPSTATPTPTPLSTPTTFPTSTLPLLPTSTPNPTMGWETYTNNEISFKYPSHWATETNRIIGTNPDVVIYLAAKGSTLMNECMKLDTTEKRNDFVIKKFSRVTTGAMCLTEDSTPREIWVIPTEDDYAPGMSYSYSIKDSPEVENIFNQILSTFKFLD